MKRSDERWLISVPMVLFLSWLFIYSYVLVYEDPLTQVTEAATERETYREGMISIKEPGEIFELPPRYIFPIHEDDFLWDGIRGDLTSPSGERDPANIGGLGDGFHEGFDSWGISEVVTWQARVVAVADGVVRNHWYNDPVKGEVIEILHDDGSVSESSHLSEAFVKERRVLADGSMIPWRVKQGDVIGRIGNTGMSKGKYKYKTHLHFSLRLPDEETGELEYVNPLSYIPIPE